LNVDELDLAAAVLKTPEEKFRDKIAEHPGLRHQPAKGKGRKSPAVLS
jgi:hypothetical protein